jgi:hypothetical protein
VTKVAAESLCELFRRDQGLPTMILRTSRFFPEDDDNAAIRESYVRANAQVNEMLNWRVGRYIISATAPFSRDDLLQPRREVPSVVHRLFPDCGASFAARAWKLFPSIDRVYVAARLERRKPPPPSPFGVASPGADDAVLAAVLVALTQRRVLRFPETPRDRIAMRAAGILAVDCDRSACALHWHDLAAAGAFAEGGAACGRLLCIVVGKAVGTARPDGERARRPRHARRTHQQACGSDCAAQSPA